MEEENFKKLIQGLDKIKLNESEKSFILSKVTSRSIPSPYFNNTFMFVGTPIILAIFIFTGVTLFAQGALPGDSLYSVKVKVNEPLVGISKITPEAKADWEEVKAVRRIDEAVTLSDQGKLTPKNSKILESNFKNHVDSFSVAKDNVATTSEGKKEINTRFKTNIKDVAKKVQDRVKSSPKKENLKKFMRHVEDDIDRE